MLIFGKSFFFCYYLLIKIHNQKLQSYDRTILYEKKLNKTKITFCQHKLDTLKSKLDTYSIFFFSKITESIYWNIC